MVFDINCYPRLGLLFLAVNYIAFLDRFVLKVAGSSREEHFLFAQVSPCGCTDIRAHSKALKVCHRTHLHRQTHIKRSPMTMEHHWWKTRVFLWHPQQTSSRWPSLVHALKCFIQRTLNLTSWRFFNVITRPFILVELGLFPTEGICRLTQRLIAVLVSQ